MEKTWRAADTGDQLVIPEEHIAQPADEFNPVSITRRTLLAGTAALLAIPALAESQTGKLQQARPTPFSTKPCLMTQSGHSEFVTAVAFSKRPVCCDRGW